MSNTADSYTYDPQNRLLTASGPTAVTLTYDPIGHLQTTASAGATTTFLYAGDMLVGEYDASGNILRRYVPGPGVDEPVVWYEGAGTSDRRWLHADTAGSVIGYSDATGASDATYAYDPYGLPDSWTATGAARYRYTGQLMIPEAHLYYYKARMYDPQNGRFLQTDPVGYQSDINLYAYVGNDPINGWDPSGMDGTDLTGITVTPEDGGPYSADFPTSLSIGPGLSKTIGGVTTVAEVVVTLHRQRANGTFGGGGGSSGGAGPNKVSAYNLNCYSGARQIAALSSRFSQAAGGAALVFGVLGAEPVAGLLAGASLVSDGVNALAGAYIAYSEGDYGPLKSSAAGFVASSVAGFGAAVFGGSITRPFSGVLVIKPPNPTGIAAASYAAGQGAQNATPQVCTAGPF
jgi:RHS repeat-associated protein